MRNQYAVAKKNDFTFLRTAGQVRDFAEKGRLDTVAGNADYRVAKVSFPYARPEVLAFIERIARRYREATDEQLVVTSLTRPSAAQPRNAHRLSVHPAGMAVDLRIPASADARRWLETELLDLERADVLDVTRERRPPHYHVAVFPEAFAAYAVANPLPPRPAPVGAAIQAVVATAPLTQPVVPPIAGMQHAGTGVELGPWGFVALAGIVLAGGAAARRRVPARARRTS
ncbi:MAG TPA: DUF5715 family protein [Gemmatimonadaceae bacterium]|nr:DUF5715 family protein [Gemmatimonadaceae bacterium]